MLIPSRGGVDGLGSRRHVAPRAAEVLRLMISLGIIRPVTTKHFHDQ